MKNQLKRGSLAVVVVCFKLLAVLVLVGGCSTQVKGPVAHRDYVTDLDFTAETDFDAAGFSANQHLRTFGTNNVRGFSDPFIFGEYRSPMDLTGGHNFHIFPDGCFAIEEFCDVGEPVTLASGRWRLEGNTLVISALEARKPSSAVLGMKWIKEQFGSPERLRVFVTADGDSIGDTILVADDTAGKERHVGWKYVRRITAYADWPKRERDLLKQ